MKSNDIIVALTLMLMCTGLFLWGKSQTAPHPSEYQITITDDSVTVFDGDRFVGTVKIQGQLDSLINLDNL